VKVIFLEDVSEVALAGQVKEVKNGFARNYLIPRGLAALATPDLLQRQKKLLSAAEKRHEEQVSVARAQAEKLEGLALTLTARVGERGKLYGSITSGDIAAKIEEASGLQVDRHKILLGQPIKDIGNYTVPVRLAPEVRVAIQVQVVQEGPEAAATKPAEAEAEAKREPEVVAEEGEEVTTKEQE